MGSRNSSPVEHARNVETEAHQDIFELRFDHLAFGGTFILILAASIALCWYCRKLDKRQRQRRQQVRHPAACRCQPHTLTNQQMYHPPPAMTLPIPMLPPPNWYPMTPMTQWNNQTEPNRFTEIYQEPEPLPRPRITSAPTARPPPSRAMELPPPPSARTNSEETN